ncbi:hypothetical protein WN48_10329 [Eufriesea mexicana]|uniref:Uncharacterized protein n=1 Tax=Eufriesea mexicana TaxID=516756 RepID=A0A310SRN3_9HYME|nr:hypothetical protein WN48_10329 [Eufriesea mexicana]
MNRGRVGDFQRRLYAPDRVAPTLGTRRGNMAGSGGAQNESLTLGSVAVRTPGPVGAFRGFVPSFERIFKIPVHVSLRGIDVTQESERERGRKRVSLTYCVRH